ncbi:MAG: 2-succinyl-6-hydroxy-2,4-cyclohexadiene-1-carboxy late synthase [Candidatus Zixiibacteriota bacterium]
MTPTLAVGKCRWRWLDSGRRDRPTIVLLHGFTGCADVWEEIIAGLSGDYRCIAVDLPGHGATECPAVVSSFRLPEVADQLASFLDALAVSPVILWGYSMGGRLALQYALRHPRMLTHLILESASPGIEDPVQRDERRRSDDALAAHIESVGIDAFVEEWENRPIFAGQHRLAEVKRARMRELRRRNNATGLALSLRGMGTGAQPPLHDELHGLALPTLLMVGESDQKFTAIGREMCARLPDATIRIIAGAGHSPYWEQPEAAVACVRQFLSGVTT